jgi:hypothetical protein
MKIASTSQISGTAVDWNASNVIGCLSATNFESTPLLHQPSIDRIASDPSFVID